MPGMARHGSAPAAPPPDFDKLSLAPGADLVRENGRPVISAVQENVHSVAIALCTFVLQSAVAEGALPTLSAGAVHQTQVCCSPPLLCCMTAHQPPDCRQARSASLTVSHRFSAAIVCTCAHVVPSMQQVQSPHPAVLTRRAGAWPHADTLAIAHATVAWHANVVAQLVASKIGCHSGAPAFFPARIKTRAVNVG